MIDFTNWTNAIAAAPWGVQRVFKSVLELAAEGKKTLVHSQDFGVGNSTCLVNAAGSMLHATGGQSGTGLPSKHFGDIVYAFDVVNQQFKKEGVNSAANVVSPLAAEILLRHFPTLQEVPPLKTDSAEKVEAFGSGVPYIEPTDEDIAADLARMFMSDPPKDVTFSEDLDETLVEDR